MSNGANDHAFCSQDLVPLGHGLKTQCRQIRNTMPINIRYDGVDVFIVIPGAHACPLPANSLTTVPTAAHGSQYARRRMGGTSALHSTNDSSLEFSAME